MITMREERQLLGTVTLLEGSNISSEYFIWQMVTVLFPSYLKYREKETHALDGRLLPVLNPLPDNKILDWFKLKVFADDKIIMILKAKFVLGRVENQHFLILP